MVNSQNISVNSSYTAQELIENHLIEGCVEVSNITSSANGSINNLNSFGYFERDLSNFPFENGIMLSTGDAQSGGNTINNNPLNDGEMSWGPDLDLETALGISNTLNATNIEFDFISSSNLIQFNYILASEEYFGNFPCDYSDGFAFLIKKKDSEDPYTNIALIPGTTIPVNTNTIHDEIVGFCDAANNTYFDGYSIGDTNYNGRTTVLTASATISPNIQYHIKLVIADQTDENYDSAVFIQGNSFNPTVDLGPDVNSCEDSHIIDADLGNPLAIYAWYQNGSLLPLETNSTLEVIESGTYSVEISIPLENINCVIEEDIEVILNNIENIGPLDNYELCDTNGDNSEIFDLNSIDDSAIASIGGGNYSVAYFNSFIEAQNNENSISAPMTNISNPQIIHVSLTNNDNGCIVFTTLTLIVNDIPNIINPSTVEVCDDGIIDGSTIFDLTNNDSEITQGNSQLSVTYHFTEEDANNGTNAIPQPYVNTYPSEILFVRVINQDTGCFTTTTINLIVNTPPVLELETPAIINACDQSDSFYADFDLQEGISNLIDDLEDVLVSFHETELDAETGENAIFDTANYENIDPNTQIIYVRVESTDTGCATVFPLTLYVNFLKSHGIYNDVYECDDISGDGIENFNLTAIGNNVITHLDDATVSFFENEFDMNANTNQLSGLYEVSSSPQTIFVKVETPECIYKTTIKLIISPPVILSPVDPIDYCDTNDDGFTAIDFTSINDYISANVDVSLKYFISEANALNNAYPLSNGWTNTFNPQTIYVRATIAGPATCFDVMPITINIIPAPTVITHQLDDIVICDDDQDGFSIVNLDSLIPEFISDTSDVTISFHYGWGIYFANNNINIISEPSSYDATTETVHIRVESNITGCYTIVKQKIIVNTLPEFIEISDYENCEIDDNQTAEFLFKTKDSEILNGQIGKKVLYFLTEDDATNRLNKIDKYNTYTNVSNPQTIYARVENNSDQDCFGISSFNLRVGSIPLFNPPTNMIVCDDISNDGTELFDFQEKIDEMSAGIDDNLSITFYTSFENADTATSPLSLAYNNIENPQQIYARIENGTFCHGIAEFGLNVVQAPIVNLPSTMIQCDSDNDGSQVFDLTVSEFEILNGRDDNLTIDYYANENDLESQSNPIDSPSNYENVTNPQTIYIEITSTISLCSVVVPLDLIVNLPPVINSIDPIAICDNPSTSFDLSDVTALLVNDPVGQNISYHLSYDDAEYYHDPLDDIFTYTSNATTIYVRVKYTETNCFSVSSFELIINPIPMAVSPPNLEACDDNNDFELVFDLSQQTSIILGRQNPSEYTVSYFETDIDAIDNTHEITDLNYNAVNWQIIYARVENNTTGCFNTTLFQTIIQRKPIVEIPDQVMCLNNMPLTVFAGDIVSGDTYLWSTGGTDSEIEIDTVGTYSVTVTSAFGCETTTQFNVTESESAIIEFTETIDFSDPNNVTITISGIGNYLYQIDTEEPQESNVFYNVSLGYHTITVIDLNGCDATTHEVVVIDAPKFMTPNSDGYFDTWHISGVKTLAGTTISIFDRYGKRMTYLTSNSEGWDGTYNGRKMPSNDYWFVADVVKNDKTFQVKGHFALRR